MTADDPRPAGGWIRDELRRASERSEALPAYARPTVTRPMSRPAASGGATDGELREESVDLTPGTVWTDKQLEVVGMLLARVAKAEEALRRVRKLADELAFGSPGNPVLDVTAKALHRALDGDLLR